MPAANDNPPTWILDLDCLSRDEIAEVVLTSFSIIKAIAAENNKLALAVTRQKERDIPPMLMASLQIWAEEIGRIDTQASTALGELSVRNMPVN